MCIVSTAAALLKFIFAVVCYFQDHLPAASTLTFTTDEWSRTSYTTLQNAMLHHEFNCGFLGFGDSCQNILEAEIIEILV